MNKGSKNLPEEILSLVFDAKDTCGNPVLSQQDLFECEFVCRNWRSPAQRVNYVDIELCADNIVMMFIDHFDRQYGKYVKSLTINWDEPPPFRGVQVGWREYLEIFAGMFPFLGTLQSQDNDAEFYYALMDVQSKWPFLENIQYPQDGKELEMYVTCILKYRHQLSTVMLCDSPRVIDSDDEGIIDGIEYDRLLGQLHQFPKLKELALIRHSNHGIESFDKDFEECPTLISLKISLYPDSDRLLRTLTKRIDLSTVIPRPSIKCFKANSVIHHGNSLLYIMYKFPQLESLSLNEGLDNSLLKEDVYLRHQLHFTASNITSSSLSQFMRYATSQPYCIAHLQVSLKTVADTLIEYSSMFPARKITSLTLIYVPSECNSFGMIDEEKVMLAIDKRHGRGEIKVFCVGYYDLGYNRMNVIERMGEYIDSLTMAIMINRDEWCVPADLNEDAYRMANGYCLDYVFNKCPNLAQLCIKDSELIHCKPNNMVKCNTITHLTLSHTHVGKDIFAELSARLPSLKHLRLSQCTFENLHNKDTDDRHINIDMEATSFDTLTVEHARKNLVTLVQLSTKTGDSYHSFSLERCCYVATDSAQSKYEGTETTDELSKLYIRCVSINLVKLLLPDNTSGKVYRADGRRC